MKACPQGLRACCLFAAALALASLPTVVQAQGFFNRCCNACCNACSNACGNCFGGVNPDNIMAGSPAEGYANAGDQYNLGEAAAAQSGNTFAALDNPGGYIDSAIVASNFRLRFDAAYDNPIPDRVEFFYAQCGILGGPGPPQIETGVDYQEIVPYLEYAFNERFSVFVEAPVRFLNPEVNANVSGFSDLNAGFKYALIACPDQYLTAQLRIYTPTGEVDSGLGTGHVSIEPSILYFRRYNECWTLTAELRDWISLSDSVAANGDPFSGNVLRYGVGLGYDVWSCCDCCTQKRLTPVGEIVGWSILQGFGTNAAGVEVDQAGVTIVNAKVGVRYTVNQHQFYAGYGTALTNQVWYDDIIRFEYKMAF